jgi:serine/threonine-protein kinase
MMIEPGTILDERYKLTKTLGEGGMANVYLAHDLILDRDVAVKVLRLDLQNDPDTLRRFRREAMATLELNHPNIVSIYDVGESDGQQYLVMEYVHGMNLKKYIALNFPIPYARVIKLMSQVLSAVQEAHSHNIIHRDLKPQNIMVDDNGTAKIADFGIAVALSDNSMTQTNSLLGSVHYLSPEQARGAMPTRQSDIYALGIILYEMLTGSVPFEGDSAVSIALKHFQEEIPSVRKFDPRIPQALENVVLKATAKSPAQRYTSVEAMNEDLATALSPKRAHEARWTPHVDDDLGETRVMNALPNALRQEAGQDGDATQPLQPLQPVQGKSASPQAGKQKPAKKKMSRKKKLWLIGGGVVAALLVILLFIIWPKGDVSVPDVSDMSVDRARTQLEAAKLTVGSEKTTHSSSVKKGYVIRTDPDHGTSVKSGSKVNLIVSSGVKKYTVDDYTGESYTDVAADLRSKGFTVHKTTKVSASSTVGTILKQSIAAGKKVDAKRTSITLTVARAEDTFTLANLVQYNYQALMGYAKEHELNVKYSGDQTGLVSSQSPVVGTKMSAGDTVTVIFASTSEGSDDTDSSDRDYSSDTSESHSDTGAQSSSSSSQESQSSAADGSHDNTKTSNGSSGEQSSETASSQSK